MSGAPPRFESVGLDECYTDRNLLVVAFARLAAHRGLAVQTVPAQTGWMIVYVDLPTGQVSWHVPDDTPGLAQIIATQGPSVHWDGHDVEQKRDRLRAFVRGL